ncbi:MAG TPA: PEGA domain-containing protein [Thermoanaerobaculia bacterium]
MPLKRLTVATLLLLAMFLAACQTTTTTKPAAPTPDDRVPVTISSSPGGAEIYLNGSLVGSTAMQFRLAPGKQRIEVRLEGFETWVRELQVLPAQPTRIEAHLKKQ